MDLFEFGRVCLQTDRESEFPILLASRYLPKVEDFTQTIRILSIVNHPFPYAIVASRLRCILREFLPTLDLRCLVGGCASSAGLSPSSSAPRQQQMELNQSGNSERFAWPLWCKATKADCQNTNLLHLIQIFGDGALEK